MIERQIFFLRLIKRQTAKAFGELMVRPLVFLTPTLDAVERFVANVCRFTSWERTAGTCWVEGWARHRAGLDVLQKRRTPMSHRVPTPISPSSDA